MPRKHYRRPESGLIGLIGFFVNRPTKNQATTLQLATGIPAERPDELRPRELEELAANVFHKLGFRNVKHTGAHSSTDGGVDVWMLNGEGHVEIVQCKQLRNRVDKSELIYFAKTMRKQHAVKGHYWSPSGFTQPAIDYAASNNIELYEEPRIRRIVEKVYQSELEQRQTQVEQAQPVLQVKSKRLFGMTVAQIIIIIGLGLCAISSLGCLVSYMLSN